MPVAPKESLVFREPRPTNAARSTDPLRRPSQMLPHLLECGRFFSAAARVNRCSAEDADCSSNKDDNDRPYNRKNNTRWMKRRSICGLGEQPGN